MRPDRPPGRECDGGPAVAPDPPCHASSPPRSQRDFSAANVPRGADSDPWYDDLSAVRDAAEDIPVFISTWQARREPDARARRHASDAVEAIDAALAALHRVRARLIAEIREADDDAAASADALLASQRAGKGPP